MIFFPHLHQFASNLHAGVEGHYPAKVIVNAYCFSQCEKRTLATAIAIGIIVMLAGAVSLAGVNFLSSQTTWILMASGGGEALLVLGAGSVIYLHFMKDLDTHLTNLSENETKRCEDIIYYPVLGTQKRLNPEIHSGEWLGHSYQLKRRLHLEFHRTSTIQEERTQQIKSEILERK